MGVDLIGKISHQIYQYFDEVFYLDVVAKSDGTNERILITDRTDKITAKDRSGKLNAQEPADLGLVFNKIRGKKNV